MPQTTPTTATSATATSASAVRSRGSTSRYRTWPSPTTTYFVEVSSGRPIGPRACSFCVEMPISAPKPNSAPSVNRVDALTITAALSTVATNRRAACCDDVTIASVWPLPYVLMCRTASSSDATTPTARSSERYSAYQSSSVTGTTSPYAAVAASPCTVTPATPRAARTFGRNSPATASCTSSVSAALQTEGRDVFALTTMSSAIDRSAVAST